MFSSLHSRLITGLFGYRTSFKINSVALVNISAIDEEHGLFDVLSRFVRQIGKGGYSSVFSKIGNSIKGDPSTMNYGSRRAENHEF